MGIPTGLEPPSTHPLTATLIEDEFTGRGVKD